ncbi:cuticle protein 67-like [Macrosteles quadrilineatus]|uniref:cuticle protein 67-like n=1 Tax=Macrosteles quadrilineatus TaxID=74068 RepID=UPI0023E23FEE|nr:cuticle protein 67-like [Macrosteles quadrilineatus]
MAFKLIVLAAALAVANAGYLAAPAYAPVSYAAPAYAPAAYAAHAYAPAAVTSTSANILRTPGNLGQVSTYTKTIDTPYSSVSKSDVRVSNPGYATYAAPAYHAPLAYAAKPVAYAAPAAYAAPVVKAVAPAYAAPVAAPVAHGLLGVAYSAAPAVAHMTYTNSYGIQYAY